MLKRVNTWIEADWRQALLLSLFCLEFPEPVFAARLRCRFLFFAFPKEDPVEASGLALGVNPMYHLLIPKFQCFNGPFRFHFECCNNVVIYLGEVNVSKVTDKIFPIVNGKNYLQDVASGGPCN